ncbi:hypothetical protein RB195_003160 [Necator americanus]|uniref:Uncharacterized protein n=1 Tax=Necator americanus TaxID=51031 RepID=A0ABR1DM99_NECAM
MRAKKERLTDGYPGKPGAIRQGVRDPSSQLFSVVEDLEATDDCRMATPESRQARQRGTPDWGLSSKSMSPLAKRANYRFTVLMVVVPWPNLPLMLRAAAVAPKPPRH